MSPEDVLFNATILGGIGGVCIGTKMAVDEIKNGRGNVAVLYYPIMIGFITASITGMSVVFPPLVIANAVIGYNAYKYSNLQN